MKDDGTFYKGGCDQMCQKYEGSVIEYWDLSIGFGDMDLVIENLKEQFFRDKGFFWSGKNLLGVD